MACGTTPAGLPDESELRSHFESFHVLFESMHFRSGQGRLREQLETHLRRRDPAEQTQVSLEAARHLRLQVPLAVDDSARLDPTELLYKWAGDPASAGVAEEQLLGLLAEVEALMMVKPAPLVDLSLPVEGDDPRIVLVGDLHGQLLDALHILHTQGPPSRSCMYLFNGDITDRGSQAVEIWTLILAFKLRFPDNVHVLRGNHENRAINERPRSWGGGFAEECLDKHGLQVYEAFQRIFLQLPLFAVLQDEVFVVHGGLFRTPNVALERLRGLSCWQKPYPMPVSEEDEGQDWNEDEAILFDAQWADPHPMLGFRPSNRGRHIRTFGRDVTADFLAKNRLQLCVRSHEVPRSGRGYWFTHDSKLLTIFSASNYAGMIGNRGAVAVFRSATGENQADGDGQAAKVRQLGRLRVEVVEHDISLDSPADSSSVLRRASVASRARDVTASRPDRDRVTQQALELILFSRVALESKLREASNGSNIVPKTVFLETLGLICNKIDWEGLMQILFDLGPEVDYQNFFDAIRVRWMYINPEQAAALADVLLHGELGLQDIGDLFNCRKAQFLGIEQCSFNRLDNSVKLLLPKITERQLQGLQRLLGLAGQVGPSEFVHRLMLFAPPLHLPRDWMPEALMQLGELLRAWAGVDGTHETVYKFFTEHQEVGKSTLDLPQTTEALVRVLSSEKLAGHALPTQLLRQGPNGTTEVDSARVGELVEALDSNDNRTVTYFELVRALGPGPGEPEVQLELRQLIEDHRTLMGTGTSAFAHRLFVYRDLLLQGCELMDAEQSGWIEPEVFVEVTKAVGELLVRPVSEAEARALRGILGADKLHYAAALRSFEVRFERTSHEGAARDGLAGPAWSPS